MGSAQEAVCAWAVGTKTSLRALRLNERRDVHSKAGLILLDRP